MELQQKFKDAALMRFPSYWTTVEPCSGRDVLRFRFPAKFGLLRAVAWMTEEVMAAAREYALHGAKMLRHNPYVALMPRLHKGGKILHREMPMRLSLGAGVFQVETPLERKPSAIETFNAVARPALKMAQWMRNNAYSLKLQ